MNKARVLLIFLLLLLFIQISYSTEQVIIEFLYHDPSKDPWYDESCEPCFGAYKEFLNKSYIVNRIEEDYGSRVLVNRTDFLTPDGRSKAHFYNITNSNSLVMKDSKGNFTVIEGNFNETYIGKVIDAYLAGETPPPPSLSPLIALLTGAFSVGFLESFSPCLIALLSFVLSYTIGKTTHFREGLLQVMAFGTGFVSATVLLVLIVVLTFISLWTFHFILMWVVCIFAIFFGLDLLGFNVLKFLRIKFETKPFVKKLSRKYVFTYAGLILLGFVFYFLDPCLAPFVVAQTLMLPSLLPEHLFLTFFVFSLGVITPFIIIGIFAGSISKLARSTYRHRSKIRAVSGLILIVYALYLIVEYLIF